MTGQPTPASTPGGEWLVCPSCRRRSLHVPADNPASGYCAGCKTNWTITAALRRGPRR